MRRYRLLMFLSGGRTKRHTLECRTDAEAFGQAIERAARAEALDFLLSST